MAACATLPAGEQIVRRPRTLSAFFLEGRIAVRQDQVRHYANMTWRHSAGQDEIFLTTPLGQGVAELRRDAAGARLLTADHQETVAADWEDLATQVFGYRLPLDGLSAWLAGRPPQPAIGWKVEYLDYDSTAADALPTLIELRRNDLEIRVKVDQWSELQ
jgi:outer membrane lipoprotein LolB